jgi:uncharacterized protein (UPF0335 family)
MTTSTITAAPTAAQKLKSVVERIENLEVEKKGISSDIKDIYTEDGNDGYDKKALKALIRLRKKAAAERQEQEALLETYMNALGMV